jgi:hypothetical protein
MSHIVDPAHQASPEKKTNVIESEMINHPVKFGIVLLVMIL